MFFLNFSAILFLKHAHTLVNLSELYFCLMAVELIWHVLLQNCYTEQQKIAVILVPARTSADKKIYNFFSLDRWKCLQIVLYWMSLQHSSVKYKFLRTMTACTNIRFIDKLEYTFIILGKPEPPIKPFRPS